MAQRNADLASLNNKVAEIQTLLDGVNQDYAAIEIPPTPLNDELQGLGSLSSADEALIGVIDTPWQSKVRWSNGTDATVFSDSTGALALSNAYSSSSWVRPGFMAGEQAAIDYLQHLWSSGRGALRWANATRASVASQAYEQWHARPYRWDGQAFSVSVLNGNQMRTVRDNLYAFQDEAAAFTAAWEDISATAAAIAARRDEIEALALALATWLEERPITLPAAEMAYRIRFTGPSGEQAWIRFEAILSKISQLGGEAPLVAAAAGREAEWLEQQCQVALDLVEDDIAFNAELSASGEKAVRAADLLAMFRGDYQGKNYPGYLYDALAETDEHLRAHFLPDIYKIYLNDVLLEDHGEHLRFYLDYLDSLPGWTLRNFTEWVQEIRGVSDQLINARWRHLLGQTWNFDMEAYHEDGGQGRIIFPENRDMVDAAINTRWGGSRSNVEPGDPNRGRTWSEDAGYLSMEEIRLGLPKLRSFVASLPNQGGGTTPPPANYSISQGPNPYLSENGRSANQVKVSVTLDGSPAPLSTPVICEFDIGAAMPMRLLTFTNEAAEAHFTLDVGLPTGALALSFSIDNQDLLTWNVSVDSDSDGDGLGDLKELELGMDPDFDWDGLLDSDGLGDGYELRYGGDPLTPLQPEGAWLEWLSEWVPADWQEGEPLYTFALHRSGDTLFAYMAGLRIIDMSDPQALAEIGFWNAEVDFDHVSGTLFLQDFASQGDHLLIATGSSGWLLMDVADPANLAMIATGFDHECGQLAVDGEWIAMGEQWQRSAVHIYRWDAANLPVKTASIPTDYYDGNIALSNGLLAIPRSAGGLLLYQLIEGAEPELVAEWTDAVTIDSMVWRGDLLYASGSEPSGRTGLWFLKYEDGSLAPVKPFLERAPNHRSNWLALAEDWEIAQFGDLRYSGEDDPDNDGLSNFLEYHVDTDPLRADSNGDGMSDGDSVRFGYDPLGSIQSPTLPPQVGISVPAQGMLRLDFDPGGDAAAVVLESSTDLIEWTPVEITPAVNGSQHQWDITLPADDSRFYRIRH